MLDPTVGPDVSSEIDSRNWKLENFRAILETPYIIYPEVVHNDIIGSITMTHMESRIHCIAI
jgi:hypothetical protein